MANPGSIGSAMPSSEDSQLRKVADLDRQLREVAASVARTVSPVAVQAATAQTAAAAATVAAETATTIANGKNRIIFSPTADASGTGYAEGDLWMRTASGVIVAQWEFTAGAWASRTVSNLSATALDGRTITGALIRTAASGARVELTTAGLKGYDAAGVVKTSVGTDGLFNATGATIDGAINATSGTISGDLAITGSVTATLGGAQFAKMGNGAFVASEPDNATVGSITNNVLLSSGYVSIRETKRLSASSTVTTPVLDVSRTGIVLSVQGVSPTIDARSNYPLAIRADTSISVTAVTTVGLYAPSIVLGNAGSTVTVGGSEMGETAWATPTLGSGWTHEAGNPIQYKRKNGLVRFRGRAATTGASSVMLTLPTGYLPDVPSGAANTFVADSTTTGYTRVNVPSTGTVNVLTGGALNGVSLAAVSFTVA